MAKKILITGAAGRIGRALVEYIKTHKAGDYVLLLADLKEINSEGNIKLDITDLAACNKACEGVDVVIHLAGVVSPESPYDAILPNNIVGTYNIFRAAHDAGVQRVVFASSAQVIEGYPLDIQVNAKMPIRPKNLYGVSKAYGEALASYFAYQEGIEAIAVRIGAFEYPEEWKHMGSRDLSAWASPRDICTLLVHCVEADLVDGPFLIAHGISNNRFKRLDLTETSERLRYIPEDDAFEVWDVGLKRSSIPNS
ncbi:MAG: NAD-dependent epimerase/dehydratase family protein [Rhodothermales bacterium]